VERQRAGVNTKEGLAAYHLNASIVEVKRIMRRDGFGFSDWFIVETIRYRKVGYCRDTG